jgi:hypothetical protein
MIETKNIGKQIVHHMNCGGLWVKEFEFEKVHIELDELGNSIAEHPFSESVFLITLADKMLWLKRDEIIGLKSLLNGFIQ